MAALQNYAELFGTFITSNLEANPLRTFLALVAIFLASVVASSWVMLQFLAPSATAAGVAPPAKRNLRSSRAKAGGKKE